MKKITTAVKGFWAKIPNAIRSAWITAWITFIGSVLSIVTGLMPRLSDAISTGNFQPFYDSLSLGYTAAVSAVLAFFAGLVNGVYRWLQPIQNSYRDTGNTEE